MLRSVAIPLEFCEYQFKITFPGVILPTTAYILRLKPPPVRKMLDQGVIVALGTDFNPNAFCLSMPLVMHLGTIHKLHRQERGEGG